MSASRLLIALTALLAVASAQTTCTSALQPSYSASVASGYRVGLVATGLARPRGLQFDSDGHLLVVEAARGDDAGISALTLNDGGGVCVGEASRTTVVSGQGLTHGIALSGDGTILYASSEEDAYSWTYDPIAQSASDQRTVVEGLGGIDSIHRTRTLLLSQFVEDTLLVSLGSNRLLDPLALDITSGFSQIRAFNIGNLTSDQSYTYASDGLLIGWGLRNSVGVAEHPVTGGIWSVENSEDNMERNGESVRENNPGEELNFHGYLNGTEYEGQGSNYGFPQCYAVWDVESIPENDNLSVGSQFAADGGNGNDTYCAAQVPPRLSFLAHTAPLDIKFNNSGNEAWISFHGSWNRDEPSGYRLSMVPFENGEPVAAPDSTTAAIDIYANVDLGRCPDDCFRPAGLAFDSQGRLFMSSDSTGEIYVITRDSAAGNNEPTGENSPSGDQGSQTGEGKRVVPTMCSMLGMVALAGYLQFF